MDENLRKELRYVGLFETVLDELDALLEVLGQVESLMVFAWDVFVEGDVGSGVVETGSTRSSQHRLDSEFWVREQRYF